MALNCQGLTFFGRNDQNPNGTKLRASESFKHQGTKSKLAKLIGYTVHFSLKISKSIAYPKILHASLFHHRNG